MLKTLKVTTALMLCAVFIFKMLFVNIDGLSSLSPQKNNDPSKVTSYLSLKHRGDLEAVNNPPASCNYLIAEIYEGSKDNDDETRSHLFVLLHALYSQWAVDTENRSKLSAFNHYFSSVPSSRYLLYQVFRI